MNAETEDRYRKLAANFYSKRLDNQVTPKKIGDALLKSSVEYRPAYFRRLRNALAFDQKEKGFAKAADYINKIKNPVTKKNAPLMLKKQKPKKQKRVKTVSNDDFLALFEAADDETKAALYIARTLGCRPAEMANIEVNGNEIKITGAKKTEGGDRGADRLIQLSSKEANNVAASLELVRGAGDNAMTNIAAKLHRLSRKVFPKRKLHTSFYSFRHQMGSNLKASGMSREQIAYVMGHQSTASADVYGNKRSGGGKVPEISKKADMGQIREKHSEFKPTDKTVSRNIDRDSDFSR
jgi:integrase